MIAKYKISGINIIIFIAKFPKIGSKKPILPNIVAGIGINVNNINKSHC